MRCPFVDSRNDRLNENQSKDFLKFWRNLLSHERPHLAIWVKLSRPVCVSTSSIVSMKKVWKDLLKFVWLLRADAINSLSWVRGLVFITVTGFLLLLSYWKSSTYPNFLSIIFIFFNTFFSFILCRLRGAVKQPINGLLYTQVIENHIIINFLTKYW